MCEVVPTDTSAVKGFGPGERSGALPGLARDAVGETDLAVERHALDLEGVEVVHQCEGCALSLDERFPEGYAHGGPVRVAPAQERRACASPLLGQGDRQEA